MHRLGLDANVQKAAQEIGINVAETAQEADGTKYIGNINWNQGLSINAKLGNQTLNPRQFVDFLNLLKSGRAYNGNGNVVDSQRLGAILDEIVGVRDPWRAEWLDAKFDGNNLVYHVIESTGQLREIKESLVDYLSVNKTPGINMNDWLKDANYQGLPKSNIKDGKLFYWAPFDGTVAGFFAVSGRADLDCDRDPSDSFASLGVRVAREKN